MYAVISSLKYHQKIKEVMDNLGRQIIYEQKRNSINIVEEIEIITRFNLEALIIDVSSINNVDDLPLTMKQYRIHRDNTRIIIIAPDYVPGNKLMKSLVGMGIYDIINEDDEDKLFISLLRVIREPTSYSIAAKWDKNIELNNSVTYYCDNNKLDNKIKKDNIDNINDQTNTVAQDGTDDFESNCIREESQKLITTEKLIGNIVIAVVGSMKRVGTTHTAISIANFLVNKDYKVAIIELHKSECFKYIKNSYFNVDNVNDYNFILSKIHFYSYYDSLQVASIIAQNYDYIVLDMGQFDAENKFYQEFERANRRIIVTGSKDWELHSLEEIMCETSCLNNTCYYFTFSDDKTYNLVKRNMGKSKCYKSCYMPNPFEINKEFEDLLYSILEDYLPNNQINKKQLFNVTKSFKKLFVQGG